MGKDKLKNTWSTIKTVVKSAANNVGNGMNQSAVFKANDPNNTQGRVSPFQKDFYSKPYGKSNKVTGVVRPGKKK
jgi:hypothetical protein